MPKKNNNDTLKAKDADYQAAMHNAVQFIEGRKQALYKIAGTYHLDVDDLKQEAYEVLLTCLRDFTPVHEKASGEKITVKFTTFFGNRMENRARELRNTDGEYQARQAMTDKMSDEEKQSFRKDPPLLVHHLDMQTNNQAALDEEVSFSHKLRARNDLERKRMLDSYFERRLNQLIAAETDEKKRLTLQHVKVGGIANFNEIAYQFGVTDSRASQVLNELIDAFYVQRLVNGDIDSVAYDFDKLKFNAKRIERLLEDAADNSDKDNFDALVEKFKGQFPALAKRPFKAQGIVKGGTASPVDLGLKPYQDVLTKEEQTKYPEVSMGLRAIAGLREIDTPLMPPEPEDSFNTFVRLFDASTALYPAVVTEDGVILDGARRIRAAKAQGKTEYLCVTRKVEDAAAQKILRAVINARTHKDDKRVIYYCVAALKAQGFSQQPVADLIQTSRTNVIVYDKVHKNATAPLKALFEDGLIQVTNASVAADLSPAQQEQLSDFIRGYGPNWGKGAPFEKLLKAVQKDKLADLEKEAGPRQTVTAPAAGKAAPVTDAQASARLKTLEQQLTTATLKLKDAEIWAAQREGVITSQNEQLDTARGEVEALKRELEAGKLMAYGDGRAVEEELKQLKKFLHVTERISGGAHLLAQAAQELRRSEGKRSQLIELDELIESVDKAVTALRADIQHKRGQGVK